MDISKVKESFIEQNSKIEDENDRLSLDEAQELLSNI
mgnify:CR=1 FL=1